MDCESCGLPMNRPEDHGANNPGCKYCKYCAPDGKLKTWEQVKKGWTDYLVSTENVSRQEAQKQVEAAMAKLPAWRQ